jgi:dihydrofolate synthase / folylpolyglutamate synthase
VNAGKPMLDPISAYERAEAYVTGLIMGPPSPPAGSTPQDIRQRAIDRLGRLEEFLEFLGSPHRKYRTIHVGGTSGKGSTTSLVASILTQSGLKTGSHVSPYLQVSTEKLLIDGRPASASRYASLVETMRSSIDEWERRGHQAPTYGEVWVAMTFVYFEQEQVDIAVIEVGAGGRFDLTNVVQPDVAAITSIGYDHMVTLGSTLPEIAWHKAGILKPGAAAVTSVTDPAPLAVIESEAELVGAVLKVIRAEESYTDVRTDRSGTSFLDVPSGRRFSVTLSGKFQAANAALATAMARALDDDRINDDTISRGLAAARFPGRLEIVQDAPLVILDGAHNPEKISHLAHNLKTMIGDRRLILVFGVLESKNYADMWAELEPHASILVATAPEVLAKPPVGASDIAALAPNGMPVFTEDAPLEALHKALEIASPDDAVLVTGSLYLIGNVREHWFPTPRILEQGTSWPE